MADKNETSRVVIDEDTPEISYVGKKTSDITVKVDVDISEALTGLKALQREAKKAAKELRELESSSQALRELEEAHAKSKYFLGFRTHPNTEGDVE